LRPGRHIEAFACVGIAGQLVYQQVNALVHALFLLYDARHGVKGIDDPSTLGVLTFI
jgi:hypothetical protein